MFAIVGGRNSTGICVSSSLVMERTGVGGVCWRKIFVGNERMLGGYLVWDWR